LFASLLENNGPSQSLKPIKNCFVNLVGSSFFIKTSLDLQKPFILERHPPKNIKADFLQLFTSDRKNIFVSKVEIKILIS